MASKLQSYYEKVLITLPRIIDYMKNQYNINITEMIIIMIINNANRNANKIRAKDISIITGHAITTINTIVNKLKRKQYITLNYDYKVTDQGRRIIKSYSYINNRFMNIIERDSIISFANYSCLSQKKANYNYKVKHNIVEQPKKSKYYNK